MNVVIGGCIHPACPLQVDGYMFAETVLSSGIEHQSPTLHSLSIWIHKTKGLFLPAIATGFEIGTVDLVRVVMEI